MKEPPLRIAIIGDGLMGRSIEALGREQGLQVSGPFGGSVMRDPSGAAAEVLGAADVALEFSTPASVVDNIGHCLAVGCPVVVGTTGWLDRLPSVSATVEEQGGALLWAANFSVGVAILAQLVKRAGQMTAGTGRFEPHLIETHHVRKRDAPSGTALELARRMGEELGSQIPITSNREGEVPGTHEVTLSNAFERITLAHEALDRRVFADGALVAARWLQGRKGMYTMDDVFELEDR